MICLLTFAYYSYSYSYNYNNYDQNYNYYDSDYGYCAGGIIHSLTHPTTTSTPASTHTRTQQTQTRTNFTPCGYLNAKGYLAYLRFSTLHRHESPQFWAALYIHTRHRHTTRESPLSALRSLLSVLRSLYSTYISTYLPTYLPTYLHTYGYATRTRTTRNSKLGICFYL